MKQGIDPSSTCHTSSGRAADRTGHGTHDSRRDSQTSRPDDRELIENPMYSVAPVPVVSAPGATAPGAGCPLTPARQTDPGGSSTSVAAPRLPIKEERYPMVSERVEPRHWGGSGGVAGTGARSSAWPRRPPSQQQQQQQPANRTERLKSYVRHGTEQFFGVDEADDSTLQTRWLERRRRMAARVYGRLKDDDAASGMPQMALPADDIDSSHQRPPMRKQHVARITWDGLVMLTRWVRRRRRGEPDEPDETDQSSRSERTKRATQTELATPITARTGSRSFAAPPQSFVSGAGGGDTGAAGGFSVTDSAMMEPVYTDQRGWYPSEGAKSLSRDAVQSFTDEVFFDRLPAQSEASLDALDHHRTAHDNVQWQRHSAGGDAAVRPRDVGHRRISSQLLDRVFDNSNRRQFGRGLAGKLFGGWTLRRSVARRASVRQQVDDMEDHRPYFSYWVTSVQTLIMLMALVCYGFGPVGFELKQQSGRVLDISLSLQQVDYWEPPNIWLGPRAADLIHLGAKFAPCMRPDDQIQERIQAARDKERLTACCIRNDNSGCVQSAQTECSNTISTWQRWSDPGRGPQGRMYGSVCGLDPRFCAEPRSSAPNEWPEDITKWPICHKTTDAPKGLETVEHMVCEVVGHPCCVGIHGRCQIATREYCNFVRGFFHEEAALCSQVSCLDDVCGMMPFFDPDTPDQFYRLWTSLFLHAGVIHLVFTILIQHFFLRDLEKMAGPVRIGLIYVLSGVGGNMASAIFVPYRAEVGPAGSQFGMLACHFVELLNAWPMLKNPWRACGRLVSLTLILFTVGLLPWVDNYAHLFGFLVGFLLSYALLPYVTFGPYDGARKKVLIGVCLVTVTLLLLFLIVLFYLTPFYECTICEYFNCLPLTRDFCAEQNIEFNRHVEA